MFLIFRLKLYSLFKVHGTDFLPCACGLSTTADFVSCFNLCEHSSTFPCVCQTFFLIFFKNFFLLGRGNFFHCVHCWNVQRTLSVFFQQYRGVVFRKKKKRKEGKRSLWSLQSSNHFSIPNYDPSPLLFWKNKKED